MRLAVTTFLCMGLLAGPLGAAGAQNLYGPGGLILHPTADVPPKGQVTPAVLILPQRVPWPGNEVVHTWGTGTVDYGLTDDLEVGYVILGITDWPVPDPSIGGFAKNRFLSIGGSA